MWKFAGFFVKRFWGLCAFLLISLAVLVSLGRELAPQVANYRLELESYLSDLSGANVSIESVQAHWQGLSPQLEFHGVRVQSTEGEPLFSMETVWARLNLLHSLFALQLVLDNLVFDQLEMGFVQQPDGRWSVRGLERRSTSGSLDLNDPLDVFLTTNHIEVFNARLAFDFRTGHHTELSFPAATLENSGNFHRLKSQLMLDGGQEVLSLLIEAKGDPRRVEGFSANGYLRLRDFDLDRVMAALPWELWQGLPEQEWRQGSELNLDLWLSVVPGIEVQAHGFLDIGELPLAVEGIQVPLRTSTQFVGQWEQSGAWKIALRNLNMLMDGVEVPTVDLQLSSRRFGQPIQVQIAELDLEPWVTAIGEIGLVQGWARDALHELNPRGLLRNASFSLAGTGLNDITVRALLHDVVLDSWRGAPAVEGLNGYVESKPLSGFVDIASQDGFSMHYPTIYREPLVFDTARGRVHWHVDLEQRTVDVHSGLLAFEGPPGSARGYFSLHLPLVREQAGDELILQIGLQNSNTSYHKQLVPYTLPKPLLDWLEQSIGDGHLSSGGFLFRGGLRRESAGQTSVQLFLNVEDAELAYHPDWPALQDAAGVIWLDNQTVVAELGGARVFDTQVEEGFVRVEPQAEKNLVLDIEAKAAGKAADGLRFLRETPLQGVVGGAWLDAWKLDGELRSAVSLAVPLGSQQAPEIRQIDLDLKDTVASNDELDLTFEAVQGRLSYNDTLGLHAPRLTGTLWGQKVVAEVAEIHGDYRALNVSIKGEMDIAAVQEWSKRPELAFASGAAPFVADLFVPYSSDFGVLPRLTIRSELDGVGVDLPAPFGKTAEEPRTVEVSLSLEEKNLLEIRYSDLVHAAFELQRGNLLRAGVGIGGNAQLLDEGGFLISGTVPQADFAEWSQAWQRYQEANAVLADQHSTGKEAGSRIAPRFDLSFGSVFFEGFQLDDLKVNGEELADRWVIGLDSSTLGGEVNLYADPARPTLLNLSHVHLPAAESEGEDQEAAGTESDLLADFDPRRLPPLDVNVDALMIGDADFGSWAFELRPTETGLLARNISGSIRGGHFLGLTDDEGAELEWRTEKEGLSSSRFRGRFVTEDLGSVLEGWGQPRLLDSESSQFVVDLRWSGSPTAIAVTELQGQVRMTVRHGSFVRGAGEGARAGGALLELISFFNFDSWLRRIRVEFSDLKRSGMAFESIRGVLHFDQGRVIMDDPVVVNSFSSRLQMAGVVDLVDSSLNTRLVATIPVAGNLTFMAGLGFGLPGVAGMWLISKVFEEQIDKVSSLSFDVSGSLRDPKMKFVRFFDHEAVHEATRAELQP